MGMSTHVIGYQPPDSEWRIKKNAWDACVAAGIAPPAELNEFFGWDEPDDHGREITEKDLINCGALEEWNDSYRKGFELDVEKLPPYVKIIRFYNAW